MCVCVVYMGGVCMGCVRCMCAGDVNVACVYASYVRGWNVCVGRVCFVSVVCVICACGV